MRMARRKKGQGGGGGREDEIKGAEGSGDNLKALAQLKPEREGQRNAKPEYPEKVGTISPADKHEGNTGVTPQGVRQRKGKPTQETMDRGQGCGLPRGDHTLKEVALERTEKRNRILPQGEVYHPPDPDWE